MPEDATEQRHGDGQDAGADGIPSPAPTRHAISNDKLRHIRLVAEVMRACAVANGMDDEAADAMFLLGFVHDIGYMRGPNDHAAAGADILAASGYAHSEAVRHHGRAIENPPTELVMLWHADMTCDHCGRRVSYAQRLAGIIERYGKDSSQARHARRIVERLEGQTEVVLV